MGLGLLTNRRAWGILLGMGLLLGGRFIHQNMLLGDEEHWREHLWLDGLLAGPGPGLALAAERPAKPVLTTPLPVNTCSLDSLTLLPRVGPVLAGRIDEARKNGLVFRDATDLQQVKGIGPALSARLDTLIQYFRPDPADTLSTRPPNSR